MPGRYGDKGSTGDAALPPPRLVDVPICEEEAVGLSGNRENSRNRAPEVAPTLKPGCFPASGSFPFLSWSMAGAPGGPSTVEPGGVRGRTRTFLGLR